jgi:hypothetical protein
MRHDSPSEELRRIAASKTRGYGLKLTPGQRDSAVALLADLYATGLRHGITPEDWAAVAGLDIECLDAIRWRDRATATKSTPWGNQRSVPEPRSKTATKQRRNPTIGRER